MIEAVVTDRKLAEEFLKASSRADWDGIAEMAIIDTEINDHESALELAKKTLDEEVKLKKTRKENSDGSVTVTIAVPRFNQVRVIGKGYKLP